MLTFLRLCETTCDTDRVYTRSPFRPSISGSPKGDIMPLLRNDVLRDDGNHNHGWRKGCQKAHDLHRSRDQGDNAHRILNGHTVANVSIGIVATG